jgi:DNA-binding transcriptional ArsR family regulator
MPDLGPSFEHFAHGLKQQVNRAADLMAAAARGDPAEEPGTGAPGLEAPGVGEQEIEALAFEALGDANRRQILRILSSGGKPVQEIADAMTISRPAVSRHLRLLKHAGMVAERSQGARRIYYLQEQGTGAVREYLERVWGEAAARSSSWPRTRRSPVRDRTAADVVRRELSGRARVRRMNLGHRHVVADSPGRVGFRRS